MSDYGYLNARLRAMKTRLLSRAAMESLTHAEGLRELASGLLATGYKADLEWGRLRLPGVAGLEEGFRRHTVATVRQVEKHARANREALAIHRVLLGRWDAHNLRTLLRGKHIEASPQEIRESLLPVGELDESQLAELSSQPSMKAMIDLLVMWGSPYARPLAAEYPSYAQSRDLSALELKLDQFHYRYLIEATRRRKLGATLVAAIARRRPYARSISRGRTPSVALVREIVQREIDMVNIVTLLRLSREGLTPDECMGFFIEGGSALTEKGFRELAGQNVVALIAGLAKTPYGWLLEEALPAYREQGAISTLERNLEEYLVTRAVGLFRGDPLSSAVIIAYLYAKFNELTNLRLLLRGKEAQIPESRISEAMLFV